MSSLVFYKYDFIFLQSVSQTRKAHALYGNWTLRLWDTSPTGQFAYETFCILDYWTVRLMDSLPTRHFAYCLDSSPTDITHLILFYSGSLVGKMKSNL